jgi:1L-myo-inositol 1-phosphate cytidylyltransferase
MERRSRVTQTVILAAGSGSRLASARGDVPKPLVTVAGLALIAHTLEHARASGCTEAVVVIGFDGERVRAAVEQMASPLYVRFMTCPDHSSPNGVSLLAAEPLAAPLFFLQMVDHLFGDVALPKLVAAPINGEAGRVLVDRAPVDLDLADATRVRLAGTRVTAIGKGIDPWDAIDAGCFVLTHAVFDALRAVPKGAAQTVSAGMRQLVARGLLHAVDVDGTSWIDVDTPADRTIAERLIAQRTLAAPLT